MIHSISQLTRDVPAAVVMVMVMFSFARQKLDNDCQNKDFCSNAGNLMENFFANSVECNISGGSISHGFYFS